MPRSLTNDELAARLRSPQVDRVILDEAARRLHEWEMRYLMTLSDICAAIHQAPLPDPELPGIVEKIVMSVAMSNRSLARVSSLAGRILAGGEYTRADVLTIAARALSCDDDD
jgi:hypothetical protein